jgi:hypothetical protein
MGIATWVATWVVAPIAAVAILVLSIQQLPEAVGAARGVGTTGTFTPVYESCGKGGCTWSGTFLADDGTVSRDDIAFEGGPVMQQSVPVPARLGEDGIGLYRTDSTYQWLWVSAYALGALIGCVVWAGAAYRQVWSDGRHRRRRWDNADREFDSSPDSQGHVTIVDGDRPEPPAP